jgi:PIN domain nuclease of toxin-antitoxin system
LKLLLDTHVWLWTLVAPKRLGRRVRLALERPHTECWLSPISVWELLILAERGRLKLDDEPRRWALEALSRSPVQEAPLSHEVALRSRDVAVPHRDPADRFLVATALSYDLTFVTADEVLIRAKPCPILASR